MSGEQQANKVLQVGDVAAVPAKAPVTTYRWWGFLVTIISWGIAALVRSGKLPAELQEAVTGLGLDIIAGVIGTLTALYGGWTANQPMGFGGGQHVTKVIKGVAPFLLVLPFVTGCAGFLTTNSGQPMSGATKLHLTKQVFVETANISASLVEQDVIKDQKTKDAIFYGTEEGYKAIKDADARLAAGDFKGLDFALARVQSALDRLAIINAQHKRSGAQSRSDVLWRKQSSPVSFSRSSAVLVGSTSSTRRPSGARSSPLRNRLSWTSRSRTLAVA